ncbi:hypothetical protein BD626DRAFT_538740 [Schizophyllum amplum]|uniref:Asl1-like glycosyl hydrolase catalytic domain-containing protein n=1 Tax=Schizophyllum amplum TaxID=97359 RepID=A0A550C789_9AGAR|nr:hypothetical protein BD626DRAFT_414639 [Auriculariopsis ampla]TRM60669.1 hypothetical protein BD626DRAFT_538740 [Auriculariopsis ampla]
MYASLALIALSATAVQAGKRGLAWPYYNGALDPGVFNNGDGSVVAIYDWETYAPPSTNGAGGLGFIGMQRCTDCDSSPIGELAARQAAQGWATVFTLNEPDLNGIGAADAASWYQAHINPLSIKKAFPAVTSSSSDGQGLSWLDSFLSSCGGNCYADYINLHWYGTDFDAFVAHVEEAHSRFSTYDVVITEFALTAPAGAADQVAFYQKAFDWLDQQDYVTLYFPFVASSPSLFSANDAAGAGYVGTGSCLFKDDGTPSDVGNLMF